MSFLSAQKVIESNSIGFSCIEDLNDPFEGAALCFADETGEESHLAHNAFISRLSRNFGVLSLTRNPLNALMWSHYGDDHRGVVLGFDVDLSKLNEIDECVIPARFGDVIYSSTIPRNFIAEYNEDELMATKQDRHVCV